MIFRRHVVDRMPIDSWNDVWQKLHQQIVNVDVLNIDAVPAEIYSTIATAVIWSMRLAFSIGMYLWIDNMMRPIYAKLIPCDLGTPNKKSRPPLKRHARRLGSLGKSRLVDNDFQFLVNFFLCLFLLYVHEVIGGVPLVLQIIKIF